MSKVLALAEVPFEVQMPIHAKLSPSSRHRWSQCPGSVREEARYPSKPGGPAAVDGTHSHTLLELCLKEYKDAANFIGQTLTDHDGSFTVDAERAERVQFAINYVERRCTDLDTEVVISERKVNPKGMVNRDDMGGTVDITINGVKTIEIVDYKDGMSPVDARGNHQMEQYAVGVISEMRDAGLTIPQYFRLTIVQPKLRMKGMKGISSADYTLSELAIIGQKLKEEGAACDAPDAPLVPGESQCKYCAHAGACSALTSKALGASGIAFADVTTQAAGKEPTEMSDQQLREIIESAPLLRQMIEGAEAEALRRLEAGKQIEGIKAVRGRGSRGWSISDENEMAEKLKKMGLPKDVIWTTKLISVAQAEKASWVKKSAGEEVKMQLSDRQLKTLKTEYTKTTEGKISVAPASDPRPAVTLSAAPLFTAVESTVNPELPSFLL
jgi:hypothetical protein